MSDRIGGAFPDDKAAGTDRPPATDRPRSTSRPADRRTSFGAGGAGGRAGRPDRPNAARPSAARPRPGTDRDRPVRADRPGGDRPERRRDDRRGGAFDPPRIPESITEDQLSREVKDELRGLPADLAVTVGRYLVAAELATVPEVAYGYAQAARHLAARIGVVREVSGITAYKTGRWAEALAELRAARRLTGRGEHLPLMADAERALGRLDRALELVHGDDAKRLPRAVQIELRIVESGIRRDQGLADAAVLALQVPELTDGKPRPWSARLFYAYGDALLAAGRTEAAREAFSRAVVADEDEQTDALARLDELDGISVADLEDDEDDESVTDESDDDLDDEAEEDDEDDESDGDEDDDTEDDDDLDDHVAVEIEAAPAVEDADLDDNVITETDKNDVTAETENDENDDEDDGDDANDEDEDDEDEDEDDGDGDGDGENGYEDGEIDAKDGPADKAGKAEASTAPLADTPAEAAPEAKTEL
jgi:tetratricopeptide (TPR) repeat protein